MTDKEKEAIERLNKAQNDIWYATLYSQEEQDEDIKTVLNLIQTQQEEIEKKDQLYHKALSDLVVADRDNLKKDKIINELKHENHTLKEKLQMFIPRRMIRRIYKMIGEILRTDINPIILEKELKAEKENKDEH